VGGRGGGVGHLPGEYPYDAESEKAADSLDFIAKADAIAARAPHIGMPRCTRHAGRPSIGNAAANAASDRGASNMCQLTISGATLPSAGGSAVNGTPAAVPVTGGCIRPR
jgi:hypothetical protein